MEQSYELKETIPTATQFSANMLEIQIGGRQTLQ